MWRRWSDRTTTTATVSPRGCGTTTCGATGGGAMSFADCRQAQTAHWPCDMGAVGAPEPPAPSWAQITWRSACRSDAAAVWVISQPASTSWTPIAKAPSAAPMTCQTGRFAELCRDRRTIRGFFRRYNPRLCETTLYQYAT